MLETNHKTASHERLENLRADGAAQAAHVHRAIETQFVARDHFQQKGLKFVETRIEDQGPSGVAVVHDSASVGNARAAVHARKWRACRRLMFVSTTAHVRFDNDG